MWSYLHWTYANQMVERKFGLKGLRSMWPLDMKQGKGSCKINMECQQPAGLMKTPSGPAPHMRGGCWQGSQHKMANQPARRGATSEPMSKQRWREFKRRNMITGLNYWPLKSEPSLMCIHDCRGKRGKARVRENPYTPTYTRTHTHRHYRVVNLCFWWVDPFIVLWGRK